MKVALIHDYIKEYGGAERVLEAFLSIWPKAQVFTSVYLPQFLGPHKKRFEKYKIKTSRFQQLPFVSKLISPLRLFVGDYFKNIDLSGFDLVIVSATGAYFPNLINTQKNTRHVCYCHTPPRYLYGYKTARNWQKTKTGRVLGQTVNHFLRQVDFLSYQKPDYIICNSNEVKKRIGKLYRREAKVIYPPVEIIDKSINKKTKNNRSYYLTGGRLARAKRIDLAIKAANQLGIRLRIFGKAFAGYDRLLKKIAGPTVEFEGEVSDKELSRLYMEAQAFIYPAEDEDFGIIPVEAMMYGLPVIALNEGGVKETVKEGKTGTLFAKAEIDDVIKAIKRAKAVSFDRKLIQKHAERFSKKRFVSQINNFLENI